MSTPLKLNTRSQVGGNRRKQTFRFCELCGKEFGPLNHLSLRFCSRKCVYAAKRGQPSGKKGRTYPHLQRARIGICPICGKEFRAVKDFSTSSHTRIQKYCSKACWSVRGHKTCAHCGKIFGAKDGSGKKYCSKRCAVADMVGSKSPAWKDGKWRERAKMRLSWPFRRWINAVLARDNFRCRHCGATQNLHAHHIIPFSENQFLGLDIDNGITLCVYCHSKVHGRWVGFCKQPKPYKDVPGAMHAA